MLMPAVHLTYLVVCISLVVWVAHTLRKNGEVFLHEKFKGKEEMASSLSHLLSVGFYLVHVGVVLLALRFGGHALDVTAGLEIASTKIGAVLLILGISHFIHVIAYARLRGKSFAPLHRTYAADAEVLG